ncbi:MAG: hypothetical protein WB626_07900 [Bacteroidota bacterium]
MNEANVRDVPSRLPPPPLWRRIFGFPSTRWGWWSIGLEISFLVLLTIFFALLASGQKGGDAFFSNPLLAFSLLAAAVAAVAGGVIASGAMIWKGERSLLVFIALLIGLFVLLFAVGEIRGHD